MKNIFRYIATAFVAAGIFCGCNERYVTYSDAEYVMFADTLKTYPVMEDGGYFSVPVVSTVVREYDRTFGVEIVDKGSNAIENHHYRLQSNTIVIKAGENRADVMVEGIYDNIAPDDSLGFQDSITHVDGIGRHYLYQTAGGSLYPPTEETVKNRLHFIHQEGQQVFKYAVSRMADVSVEMMERHNLTADDIAYLIPHQANLRIIDATGRRMGLTPEKILIDIEKFGNTAGTSIPLALWDFKNKFKKGDTLIFSAFGAGFTWGSILYRWAY